ncbi:PEP-CTERM sorting domain-containing protein [Paraglaciecola sp. 25GB23A]|uniref:Npun_F0296 family exosortase-dependent surface protein n=1 Tax=Paraglaciecola sp. 25GB23A TaxID=3156068 RepID=UPI0032AFD977
MKNMLTKTKLLAASMVFGLAVTSGANAATVSFGGQAATDLSGLTSSFVDPSNLLDGSTGFFVETFDDATQTVGVGPGSKDYNVDPASSCAVNGAGTPGIVVSASAANALGVRSGSVSNVAAAPLGDQTCYGYTPGQGGALPSWVEIDYSGFLAAQLDTGITYLGFYWGSVDDYNDFEFYSGGSLIETITGSSLLAQLGGVNGSQTNRDSNVYVNIAFSFADAFDRVRITSTGVAGEFDNIVIGLRNRPVPAPTGLAFLGLGLLGLGLAKRMKK